jgi:hypothetical protein
VMISVDDAIASYYSNSAMINTAAMNQAWIMSAIASSSIDDDVNQ